MAAAGRSFMDARLGGKAEYMFGGNVRASAAEHSQSLPGDDRIPWSIGALTHAVTINAPEGEIWPWLVQMPPP